jgi:hypothetical protein
LSREERAFDLDLESSSPQKLGDKARLVSTIEQPANGRCLEFWYHMYGRNVGQLNVYVNTNISNNSSRALLWSRGANVGNVWRKAQVSTEYTVPFRIIFEGVIGNGFEVSAESMKKVADFLTARFFRAIFLSMTSIVYRSLANNRTTVISKTIVSVDGKT